MTTLGQRNDTVSYALRFNILCALRQLETRRLRWSEVRSDRIVIPAERYKTRREHVVPLSPAALAIIEAMRLADREPKPDESVFPGEKKGRALSRHRFATLIPDSSAIQASLPAFVVWCVEAGDFTDELAQRCLGHVIGTETPAHTSAPTSSPQSRPRSPHGPHSVRQNGRLFDHNSYCLAQSLALQRVAVSRHTPISTSITLMASRPVLTA